MTTSWPDLRPDVTCVYAPPEAPTTHLVLDLLAVLQHVDERGRTHGVHRCGRHDEDVVDLGHHDLDVSRGPRVDACRSARDRNGHGEGRHSTGGGPHWLMLDTTPYAVVLVPVGVMTACWPSWSCVIWEVVTSASTTKEFRGSITTSVDEVELAPVLPEPVPLEPVLPEPVLPEPVLPNQSRYCPCCSNQCCWSQCRCRPCCWNQCHPSCQRRGGHPSPSCCPPKPSGPSEMSRVMTVPGTGEVSVASFRLVWAWDTLTLSAATAASSAAT